jgi:preprotein translocase subunit SecG
MENDNPRENSQEKSFEASPKPIAKATLILIIVFIIMIIGVIFIFKFFNSTPNNSNQNRINRAKNTNRYVCLKI